MILSTTASRRPTRNPRIETANGTFVESNSIVLHVPVHKKNNICHSPYGTIATSIIILCNRSLYGNVPQTDSEPYTAVETTWGGGTNKQTNPPSRRSSPCVHGLKQRNATQRKAT
mmetsp:Transcript_7122/g.17877  ORF Transcript_7122/g.17877 Transcript_7122/m.17877 type:complete len:115 (+) Transcript_7122:2319-2663(+)